MNEAKPIIDITDMTQIPKAVREDAAHWHSFVGEIFPEYRAAYAWSWGDRIVFAVFKPLPRSNNKTAKEQLQLMKLLRENHKLPDHFLRELGDSKFLKEFIEASIKHFHSAGFIETDFVRTSDGKKMGSYQEKGLCPPLDCPPNERKRDLHAIALGAIIHLK